MVHPSTARLELRDSAKGVEGRVSRGDGDGWTVLTGWLSLPIGAGRDLLEWSDSARAAPQDWLETLGNELWRALQPLQNTIRALDTARDVARWVVGIAEPAPDGKDADGSAGHLHASDLLGVLWRSLRWVDEDGSLHTPFLNGPWALLLRDGPGDGERAQVPIDVLDVLVVVTSLEHPDGHADVAGRLREAACTVIRELRDSLRDLAAVRVHVAASTLYRPDDRPGSPCLRDVVVDEWFGSREILAHLLQHGTLADGAPPRPIDALVFVGHSDLRVGRDPSAQALRFALPGRPATTLDVAGTTLKHWLTHRNGGARGPQLVVAANCGSAGLAFHLREVAPHVVTTAAAVEAADMARLVAGLFRRLSQGGSLGRALHEARDDVQADARINTSALIEHWAETVHDQPFLTQPERELAAYYDRHINDNAVLRNAFGGKRQAPLQQIHVALELRRQSATNEHGDQPLDPGDARELLASAARERTQLTFAALIAELQRGESARTIVLRGEAGGGKTTTLRVFTLERPAASFPVYLSLGVFLRQVGALSDWSHDGVLAAIVGFLAGTRAGLGQAIIDRERDVAFLLDGFDELHDTTAREAGVRLAKELATHFPAAIVMVAARETADLTALEEAGWSTATLRRLDRDTQQPALLGNWFAAAGRSREDAARWIADLHGLGRRVGDLCGNPLMLTYIGELILGGWDLERFRRGQHEIVSGLLDAMAERAYRRDDRGGAIACPFDRRDLRRVLRWIAWRMIGALRRSLGGVTELEQWIDEARDDESTAVREPLERMLARCDSKCRQLAEAIGEHSGVFQPEWGSESEWKFSHNLLQEALAAEHWWHVELRKADDSAAVLAHLRGRLGADGDAALDFWTEPTVLLASLLRSGDVGALAAQLAGDTTTAELGRRVLLQADRATSEQIRAVVAPSGDADRRAELYMAIPRLVADPERAAELLGDLGCELNGAEDRHWIRVAMETCGQDALDVGLARIYADAPVPGTAALCWLADTWWCRRNGERREFLWKPVAAGSFRMGSPPDEAGRRDNEDLVDVEITRPFWVMAVPVTLGMFRGLHREHRQRWSDDPRLPAVNLSWFEATMFCDWLNARWLDAVRGGVLDDESTRMRAHGVPSEQVARGWRFRLLTEAEWEFMCRAGTPTRFWSGDELEVAGEAVAWHDGNSERRLHAAAELRPNRLGVYDAHGLVWEWCRDWYADVLAGGRDPQGPERGSVRVLRGGSFGNVADVCRSAVRNGFLPGVRGVVFVDYGFRVCFGPPLPSPGRVIEDR
ncbi:MAG: SUMF1/EgtB/PvdO family nonheme iron enzyme [Planctomycetes bacterium]|nr:SUMF1/EgtB/PvdO family nonheme iron enzyme [Planctomycetota bacterium]